MFESTITSVNAHSSPIPEIEIRFEITNIENRDLTLLGYTLDVRIAGVPIGNITDYDSYTLSSRRRANFTKMFVIPAHVFSAIEESRMSGDVHIHSNIKTLYLDTESDKASREYYPRTTWVNTSTHKLSQNEWINLISDLGYRKHKIFEIPYPDTPQLPEFKNIMEALEAAQTKFYEGNNEDVVNKCRTVLEEFRTILNDEEKKAKIDAIIDKKSIGQAGKDSKSKRINEIFNKIYQFHHVGPHYHYCVVREDAEMSLVMCMSLLRYYGVQLDKLTRDE